MTGEGAESRLCHRCAWVTSRCAIELAACYVSAPGTAAYGSLSKLAPVVDRHSDTYPYALPVGCRPVMFLLSTMSKT